jgi:hypothetical protein
MMRPSAHFLSPRGLGAAAVVAFVVLAGCSSADPGPSQRASSPDICPPLSARPTLDGFQLIDRRLPALSKELLGHDDRYKRGAQDIRLTSGLNIEDELEDMELDGYQTERGQRSVRVLHSLVVPALRVALWTEPGERARCNNLAVVTHGLGETALLGVVDAVRASGKTA